MAKQFSFTDRFGRENPESYCNIAAFSVDRREHKARFEFAIYANANCAANPTYQPIDGRTIELSGEIFDAAYIAVINGTKTIGQVGYENGETQGIWPTDTVNV